METIRKCNLTKQIITLLDYNTFAKTKRFKKGVDIKKSYELMVLPHYFPGNKFDEETGSHNQFYNRKEFKRPPLGPTV